MDISTEHISMRYATSAPTSAVPAADDTQTARQYGGGRRCQQEGCSKAAQGGTQDIAHGGGRPLPPRGLLQSLLELLVPAGSVCRVRSPMTHSRPHCKPQHVMHSRLKPLLESSTTCEDSRRADSKRSRSMCQVAAYIAAWALTSLRWHC